MNAHGPINYVSASWIPEKKRGIAQSRRPEGGGILANGREQLAIDVVSGFCKNSLFLKIERDISGPAGRPAGSAGLGRADLGRNENVAVCIRVAGKSEF